MQIFIDHIYIQNFKDLENIDVIKDKQNIQWLDFRWKLIRRLCTQIISLII